MENAVVPDRNAMQLNNTENAMRPGRKNLKIKFAVFYILSVALLVFIISLFIKHTAPANTIIAKPLQNNEVSGNDLLNKIDVLNVQYKKLKQLDQDYARKVVESAPASELIVFNRNVFEAEKNLKKTVDSLDLLSTSYGDMKTISLLHNFTESFRSVINDRAAMREFKTAVSGSGNTNTDQQQLFKLQTEIQARNSHITTLENQITALQNKKSTTGVANPNNADNTQQSLIESQATISTLEKKVAALTAANATLEKTARVNADALEQAKKPAENSAASNNQTALLEKKVSDLNAEIRLAQVDCNLSRADVTQIISSEKQRKALLTDALNTLNTLASTGDATMRRKVSEKINRLNQVAAALHD